MVENNKCPDCGGSNLAWKTSEPPFPFCFDCDDKRQQAYEEKRAKREAEYQTRKAIREEAEKGSPQDLVLYWAVQMYSESVARIGIERRFYQAVENWLKGSEEAQKKYDVEFPSD